MARTIKECLEQGPYTSKEIQSMTSVSQSTVARRLIKMADRVVQVREGRSIRYAAACNAFGGDDKLPGSMVGPHGDIAVIAYIRPLCSGGFFVEPVKDISPTIRNRSSRQSFTTSEVLSVLDHHHNSIHKVQHGINNMVAGIVTTSKRSAETYLFSE